ncbi:rab-GTPase-TBC domain-containing protein [Ampelomyces quisqualis]|uniref:GTPase-activating protein GYP5 n=1 Tax=Ampelomyces quisqualis TaxID=50730 RepID=A0A6A5QN11_AMPQU|nr:rab-GTPase-TBC domain-containing protein [Ampelomyces quisqualis]
MAEPTQAPEHNDRPTSSQSSESDRDSFEDARASETTPRPDSQSERSRSSRSLISRPASSASTAHESRADSPVPEVPSIPKNVDGTADTPGQETAPAKSPLLTAHRISVTSDMDDVSLDGEGAKATAILPKLPPRDSRDSTTAMQGLSGSMSPVKFPPPPPPPAQEKTAPAPPVTRRLTSPFSWLSRNSSNKKADAQPVSTTDRRNTNASINTLGSSPELTLSRIEDEGDISSDKRSSEGSLRDRFKFLRMREEAGITMTDENGVSSDASALTGHVGRTTSIGIGIGSPKSNAGDDGTAAGAVSGPAGDIAEPVDWDLWQSVVNEGPTAIARTSSEELSRAIANGIPQVIRGVIWQVLTQSKSEELEGMYRELVARGTDKEHMSVKTPNLTNGQANGSGKEKDSVASSSSSVHSDFSTPATTNGSTNAPLPSPSVTSDSFEDPLKTQARLAAERKQSVAEVTKLEKTIKRDLGARTSYSKYVMAAGLQDGLFGICKAYALYDEAVGYAQGMNFIAMPLLFNMPEEEAFSLFVTLMNKYGLRDLFVHDMPGLHLHLYQFERLLEDFEPALYCHLRRREVKPQLYATQWFLTLFAYRFPLQLVLRIYDLILSEGLESAILKFGIVLMQKNAEALLGMKDMSTLTTFLKDRLFDVYIDKAPSANSILENGFFGSTAGVDKEVYRADMLVKDAVAVRILPETLKQYTAEWKEQRRIEKDRETELHSLKDKVASLETKVRLLESRAEQSDMEHVQVASELIKTKVENEQVAEENETLKMKAEELQKIVNSQPEEVEARLKNEMETVMQKNIVVHNENRALEEQMAEMEKELVATKMQWATINEEHESLKQKWNSISQMMK